MLDDGDDQSGRPAEHDDPVGRLEGCQDPPAFVQDHVAIPQRRVGDRREVECLLESLVAAERQISLYAFLEAPAEVDALLNQLEQQLGIQP